MWLFPGHTAVLGLDTCREEGVPGAGSCRHLPSWAETEPRKLGSPTACHMAKSTATTGSSSACKEEPQGCAVSKCDGVFGAPESFQSVGSRKGWRGIFHLSFLLGRECHPIFTPLLLASLSNSCLCFRSQDWQSPSVLLNGWSPSLQECSTCLRCPALPVTRTQRNVDP